MRVDDRPLAAGNPLARARTRLGDWKIVGARSALFDVYGSYLRAGVGAAAIAALVRLLEPLGFEAPAIRTAVSRMVRQDWLRPVRLDDGPGYALTRRAERRLDEAAMRIYRTNQSTWDGRWHVLVLEELPTRSARHSLLPRPGPPDRPPPRVRAGGGAGAFLRPRARPARARRRSLSVRLSE